MQATLPLNLVRQPTRNCFFLARSFCMSWYVCSPAIMGGVGGVGRDGLQLRNSSRDFTIIHGNCLPLDSHK
jgi:hypothetical protein